MSAEAPQTDDSNPKKIADPIGDYECENCDTRFKITGHQRTKERGLYFCPMCGERSEGPKHNRTLEDC